MVTEGRSYSAVAENALELRLPGKGSDSASANSSHSQMGTNSSSLSETDGSSSQEFHAVHSADMDSTNPKGGWTSQDECLSGENSYLEKGHEEEEEREGEDETVQVCGRHVQGVASEYGFFSG